MKVRKSFEFIKERTIDKLKRERNCRIIFTKVSEDYILLYSYFDEFSYIRFPRDNLVRPVVVINFKDLKYYGQYKLPSLSVAKKILLNMYNVKRCDEYVSVLETIINYDPFFERVSEVVSENKYNNEYERLERTIYYDENVRLEYEAFRKNELTKHSIYTSMMSKVIVFEVEKNMERVERYEIELKLAPRIFNATIRYMFDVRWLLQYKDFEKYIRTVYELIIVKKYNEEKAIKELVKKHGYRDVFKEYF